MTIFDLIGTGAKCCRAATKGRTGSSSRRGWGATAAALYKNSQTRVMPPLLPHSLPRTAPAVARFFFSLLALTMIMTGRTFFVYTALCLAALAAVQAAPPSSNVVAREPSPTQGESHGHRR